MGISLSSLFPLILILKAILPEARKYILTLSNAFSPSSLTLSHCLCPFLPFCFCLANTLLNSPKESDKLQSLEPWQQNFLPLVIWKPSDIILSVYTADSSVERLSICTAPGGTRNLFPTSLLARLKKGKSAYACLGVGAILVRYERSFDSLLSAFN